MVREYSNLDFSTMSHSIDYDQLRKNYLDRIQLLRETAPNSLPEKVIYDWRLVICPKPENPPSWFLSKDVGAPKHPSNAGYDRVYGDRRHRLLASTNRPTIEKEEQFYA